MADQRYPHVKNQTPYAALEEEQYKIGLVNGAIIGAGVGLLIGVLAMLAFAFFVLVPH